MTWRVVLGKYAEKQLRRISKKDTERITEAFTRLVADPFGGDIVKLEGQGNVWRFRVGSYRIIFEPYPKEKLLFVYDIARRTSTTY